MKIFLKIVSLSIVSSGLFIGCGKGDDNPKPTAVAEFISIRSTNQPTGNSCNVWDLQSSSSTPFSYSVIRIGDNMVSSPVLLGQTTMSNQTVAWNEIDKLYFVNIGTSLYQYDFHTGSPTAPTTSPIPSPTVFSTDPFKTIGTVRGGGALRYLFAIPTSGGLMYWAGASWQYATPGSASMPTFATNAHISNMTHDATGKLFFIVNGKLSTCQISSSTSCTSVITTPISGGAGALYDAIEYNTTDSKIYAIKRTGIIDDFVRIDPGTGNETVLYAGIGKTTAPAPGANFYITDYSRISSALDPATNTYYLICSNGHNSNAHTKVTISNITSTPTYSAVTGNLYVFGLTFKD